MTGYIRGLGTGIAVIATLAAVAAASDYGAYRAAPSRSDLVSAATQPAAQERTAARALPGMASAPVRLAAAPSE